VARTRLPCFFSNLLPEGAFQEYLAKKANINPKHEFLLLWMLGKDLPGAIVLQSMEEDIPLTSSSTEFADTHEKKKIPFRFSLAGMQVKFSAMKEFGKLTIPVKGVGGSWIVKLPSPVFPHLPENEFSMMELARRTGIDVPEIALHSIQDLRGLPPEFAHIGNHFYAIKRFDRTEDGGRIHMEDFAQVFGIYPEGKYDKVSYRNMAERIWKENGEAGIAEFVRRFVFNALIGNGDMHLKNWSFLYREKNKPSLSPAYDFVSTICYLPQDGLAMNFVDDKAFSSLTLAQFKRFAGKAQLPEALVLDTVQQTVEAFAEAWKNVNDLPLRKETRDVIERHLKTMPLWYR